MRNVVLAVAMTAGLAACGGSDSTSISYPSVSDYTPLAVTDSNAASVYSGTTTAVAGNTSPDLPSDALAYTPSSSFNSLRDITTLYPTFTASNRALSALYDNAACQGGGSLSATGSDNFESVGDYVSVTFSRCVSGDTQLNGGFVMTLAAGQGADPSVQIDFVNFASVTGSDTLTIHGDMAFDAWTVSTTQYARISSSSLNMQDTQSGDTVTRNLVITGELDANGDSRLNMAYTLGSDALAGRVDVSTPVTLSTLSADDWPTNGEIRITGDNGSYLSLDSNTGDVNTVLMTVHNSSATISNTVTWSSLEGADLGAFVEFE